MFCIVLVLTILFGLVFLLCWFLNNPIVPEASLFPTKSKFEGKYSNTVVVIFGGTGKTGYRIAEKFLEQECIVILASRRKQRFLNLLTPLKTANPNVPLGWIHCDTRLHRDVENVFTKLFSIYDKVDIAINAAILERSDQDSISRLPLFTGKDRNNILIKLPDAFLNNYRPTFLRTKGSSVGAEHFFFTNAVGLSNLNRIQIEHLVPVIVNPDLNDPLIDAILQEYIEHRGHSSIIKMKLDQPDIVVSKALAELKIP